MIFLNPLFLFGLAAAAIPLIIHLFNFRRPKRIEFSSLAFLHELQKSTMQRVRIKQWLLLALRTLAIALLVLSFARPTMTAEMAGPLGGRGRTSTAIVLDNSQSMLLRDGSGSYIEQSRTIADAFIEEMQTGDELYLLPTISPVNEVVAFQNQASARRALMAIEARDGNMRLSRTVALASHVLETSANPNREVIVLSDLQESTFADTLQQRLPDGAVTYLVAIGNRKHENIAVTDIEILSRILSVGQVVRLEATLTNFGDRPVNDLVVSLYLDGQRISRATTDLNAGETTRVPIAVTPRSTGWLGGQAEIEDADFRNDDVRRFTLFIPEERNILLVGSGRTTTAYIELALSEEVTGRGVRFNIESIQETALARASLGNYDTVVLTGVTDLSSGERAALAGYVRAGGGLLVFPGEDLVIEDYNALFDELGGGRVESITDPAETSGYVAGFDRIDSEHALFEGMFESGETGSSPRLEQPDIYRMMMYKPGDGSEQTLIRLSGDRSFLQELRYELGSVLLFTVAPDESWSDFPVRGLFIPLLYRSIYYLSAGGSVMGEEFTAGEAAQVRLTGVADGATITIDSGTGDSYLPEFRRAPGSRLALIGPGFLTTGIYNVTADEEIIRRFVVHPIPGESNLRTLSPEKAVRLLAVALGQPVTELHMAGTEAQEVKAQLKTVRSGVELWNVFMMLALFTLLAEMLVEKKWRPEAV